MPETPAAPSRTTQAARARPHLDAVADHLVTDLVRDVQGSTSAAQMRGLLLCDRGEGTGWVLVTRTEDDVTLELAAPLSGGRAVYTLGQLKTLASLGADVTRLLNGDTARRAMFAETGVENLEDLLAAALRLALATLAGGYGVSDLAGLHLEPA